MLSSRFPQRSFNFSGAQTWAKTFSVLSGPGLTKVAR